MLSVLRNIVAPSHIRYKRGVFVEQLQLFFANAELTIDARSTNEIVIADVTRELFSRVVGFLIYSETVEKYTICLSLFPKIK